MKKLILLTVATLISGVAFVNAYDRKIGMPVDQRGNPVQSADYGGVDIATMSFSSAATLMAVGEGAVVGFVASSNTAINQYVTFKDTDSVITPYIENTNNDIARVYLSSTSSTNVWPSLPGTTYAFPKPIRFKRGLVGYSNSNTLNMLTVLYNKFSRSGVGGEK